MWAMYAISLAFGFRLPAFQSVILWASCFMPSARALRVPSFISAASIKIFMFIVCILKWLYSWTSNFGLPCV